MTTTSLPRVPEGLRDLMKVYTKEVLREKPTDLYEFSAKFFNLIVAEKSHQVVRKYEPVQTYETIMKNRIRQQVPISMVFNIIPETLTDLIKKFIKAVLREKPENIYIFAQEYFQRLSKEKSGRIEYTKYSTYEKSIKDKENIAPVSKVTCECGRVLSAQSKDLGKAVSTETTKLETTTTDQTTLSNSISYVNSVVIIQRHFRRYLKQKKIGREKNKCNSVEYMTAIILIQRQFRRVLAKRRVEKLKKSRSGQLSYVKFNAANYMKAVVVIQRHYRIYLKRKQEQNRLKNGPVSLATAAIIIQRAFRRMVAVRRARRTTSVTADPGEELNDNASETGSYTSVSTALLSTESTELGIASYEEKVHQKIIHEDEEVENNNVDARLEREHFAEPIKGDEKSMDSRNREILGINSKDSIEREKELIKDLSGNETEKPLMSVIEDEFTASKDSKQRGSKNETTNNSEELHQENEEIVASDAEKPAEIEDEFTAIKTGGKLDSSPETELKTKNQSFDLQQETEDELRTIKTSIEELQLEVKGDPEAESEVTAKPEDDVQDSLKSEDVVPEDNALPPNKVERTESNDINELASKDIEDIPIIQEEVNNNGKDNDILIKETISSAKIKSSESQEITEKPIESKVSPKVSIEIELVDDMLDEDLPDSNESSKETFSDEDAEKLEDVEKPAEIDTQEDEISAASNSTNKQKEDSVIKREKRSLDDTENILTGPQMENIETQEILNKPDEETPAMAEEKRSIIVAETQSNLEDQDSLAKPENETSSLTKEKISIDETESGSKKLSLEDINPDDPDSDINEIDQKENSKEEEQKVISRAASETVSEMDYKNKEEVVTKAEIKDLKNSSLLVTNQLIGTQNLPTNRNEIEKNTKKLSSASVKDKDIGTLASGRLVPTPIAELQLKSFKAPNDDGSWYDIYVEPKVSSNKDMENPPPLVTPSTDPTEKPQEITPEMEPIVVAERVPSYYTPKQIIEPSAPKAKNSISFFVSFDSDDGKPKYKIPKKFRDQTKSATLAEKKSDPEPENNEDDIEVIEVSEGDPEYQQMGGSKLQTIMELNETESTNECNNESSPLHLEVTESSRDIIVKEPSVSESVTRSKDKNFVNSSKSDTDHYESIYKTDILNITRSNGNQLQEVVEEPCIKRSASLVSLSEGETGNDSSKSEATGLDTLSADTIDKATVKLSKPEEVIEKMAQLRESRSSDRILSAEPSFDEPIVRPMSSLQEQASLDIEDGDIIVYNRLQRDETRESSAQSDSVVFGEAESEKILDKELATEEESGRVHLMRHYTIAGDDPRGLFRSVTIDDALSYGEVGEKDLDASLGINSTNSFYLDDETSENIRKKMMAYSLSETDSDYFDPKKISKEDFDIDTAMADAMGTSTETESTIVSAATKIQAGARGFLTRRRLRRASAGTKSSTMDTKASFGNDAISESLERFIEEEAAKKIQAAYRIHTRKRKGKTRRMEGISLESNLAARRQKLQRGDALRNDSTPDDENSEAKSRAAMELKWLTMRKNSMPVQIDCEVFRVIPKHMRKRIKSAEAGKRK
ncbi:hypothetical protein KR200_000311 [Drosophila serrata]|nr:hypothetical protein KR200_000311 [Drosophila serrata]